MKRFDITDSRNEKLPQSGERESYIDKSTKSERPTTTQLTTLFSTPTQYQRQDAFYYRDRAVRLHKPVASSRHIHNTNNYYYYQYHC
jgi:hypothetical protein